MIQSLWTGATGMHAQQFNIDTISNNLSNVNTFGFKKTRTQFQDLIYQTLRLPGTPSMIDTQYPTGIQSGSGVQVSATQKSYSQGTPKHTKNPLDIAISGEGFLKVRLHDGSFAYTRNGSLQIDSNGDLVTSDGYFLEPPIRFDLNLIKKSISINEQGTVSYKTSDMPINSEPITAGNIKLYRFVNPVGLSNIGKNLLKQTSASGQEFQGDPNTQGFGKILHGFVETSNVQIVQEMVNMIVAQRAYEFNSKVIQTSDSMLATAVTLKR